MECVHIKRFPMVLFSPPSPTTSSTIQWRPLNFPDLLSFISESCDSFPLIRIVYCWLPVSWTHMMACISKYQGIFKWFFSLTVHLCVHIGCIAQVRQKMSVVAQKRLRAQGKYLLQQHLEMYWSEMGLFSHMG